MQRKPRPWQGRFAEIKVLADRMVEIFKAQKVDREALAAVILFREAAAKEQVTVRMVRRFQEQLAKVKRRAQAEAHSMQRPAGQAQRLPAQ